MIGEVNSFPGASATVTLANARCDVASGRCGGRGRIRNPSYGRPAMPRIYSVAGNITCELAVVRLSRARASDGSKAVPHRWRNIFFAVRSFDAKTTGTSRGA